MKKLNFFKFGFQTFYLILKLKCKTALRTEIRRLTTSETFSLQNICKTLVLILTDEIHSSLTWLFYFPGPRQHSRENRAHICKYMTHLIHSHVPKTKVKTHQVQSLCKNSKWSHTILFHLTHRRISTLRKGPRCTDCQKNIQNTTKQTHVCDKIM